jgi:two-component system sensor histidine kinase VicK
MEKTSSAEIEFQLANQLGKPIVLCCNAYLVFDKSAIIVFIKDITKSKEHEDYIVKYGARKNTVLDSLAHQVSGAINLMQHLASQAEKYVEATNDRNLQIYLDLLNNNSSHCLRIIYDVLKEEHQVSPGVAVRNSRIDIVEKMAIIHESLQQSYRTRKFVFFSPVKSLHINTDEVKVLQVVNNLTSNAIKFSHSTSTITLSIAMKDHMIIVSVTDEGIGIPDSMKPAIFENQFGIGRTGLNGERSIGLGLSICKDLVRLLGGDIWFDNTENKGSTFYVGLPGN